MAPIESCYEEFGSFKGVTVDMYERISEMTGLRFRFFTALGCAGADIADGELRVAARRVSGAEQRRCGGASLVPDTGVFGQFSDAGHNARRCAHTDSIVPVPADYPKFAHIAEQNGYSTLAEANLEKHAILVDTTENGQIAVDMFTASALG